MNYDYRGKVAVITGGTRGIGRALSLAFSQAGAKVYALYARDRAAADQLTQQTEKSPHPIQCLRGDLTDQDHRARILEQLLSENPEIHFLIHSAASGVHRKAEELSLKHLKWTFEINVFAFHELVRHLVPQMPRGAKILALTSSGGTRVIPYYTAVGASKGALESLIRHYAVEFAPKGIAVNALCPGLVLTDAVEAFPEKERREEMALQGTPSGKLTQPEEVAQAALFLCSSAADQIIGHTLVLDGGKTLHS